jgi:hypothetical protein
LRKIVACRANLKLNRFHQFFQGLSAGSKRVFARFSPSQIPLDEFFLMKIKPIETINFVQIDW